MFSLTNVAESRPKMTNRVKKEGFGCTSEVSSICFYNVVEYAAEVVCVKDMPVVIILSGEISGWI